MVVHDDVESSGPPTITEKKKRRSKRRASHSFVYTKNDMETSVWGALFYLVRLVFMVEDDVRGVFCRQCERAFELLAKFTHDDKIMLTQTQMNQIETAFQLVHPEIDHVFLPFVTTPTYWEKASLYLDVTFLVDFVKRYERRTLSLDMNKKKLKEVREHFRHFLNLFDDDRRVTY